MLKSKITIIICVALLIPINSFAVDPAIKKEANSIFSTVLSPYCPGRLLSHCPSGKADELKDRITADLEKGKTKEVIIDELYAEFGDDIKASPSFSGFGIVGWIIPFVFLFIGFFLILLFVKKQKELSAN